MTGKFRVDEAEFRKHFPDPFIVRALTIYEAAEKGLSTDVSFWMFMHPFSFISSVWGEIRVPDGFVTDFASVPTLLHSLYDDDSPWLLYPSAPHDLLFAQREDGTRGWLPDGRQLTLHEVNLVLKEAMSICGADLAGRAAVFAAVEVANLGIRHTFRVDPTTARSST